MKRRRKNDKMEMGFIIGLLLPVFIFLIIYLTRYPDIPILEYFDSLFLHNLLLKILSLCVFPNLLIFLLYIKRKMDRAARGVLAATILYAFFVLISNIF